MKAKFVKDALIRVILLAVLALGSNALRTSATAQTGVASAEMIFKSIVVKGNRRVETPTILNFLAIPRGKPVTPAQVNEAYKRLVSTGLFEEVSVTPKGARLLVTVREYPTINRINFERNKRIKDKVLAGVITSKPRHVYNPVQAEADAQRIIEAYRQQGRISARVTPKIIRRADNRVDLVFEIFEGKVIEIKRISFVGNRHFSDRRLRRVLGTKQAGLLHAFVKSDTFVADRINFDKQMLRDFYLSRGFIDFQVLSVDAEIVKERSGYFLTFKIREGQQYRFGDIKVTSSLAEIDPDKYKSLVGIRKGVVYAPNLVNGAVERMENLATKEGLNFIRVTPKVKRDDKTRSLNIDFVIEKGPRIFVERIDIEGNSTTLDRVIRRQFKTVEGDPFNPREIKAAAERIRALGFFAKSDVKTRPGSSPDRVIVDVNVEETQTGSLEFGVSYGAATGLGATISLSESNFLGRGQYIKLNLGGGNTARDVGLTFAEPAFLGRDLRFQIAAARSTIAQRITHYDTSVTRFSPSISFPTSELGRLALKYERSDATISNITGTPSPLIVAGTRKASIFGLTYTYDSRYSGLDPTAGTLVKLSQEIAGPGASARFSKTTALVGFRKAIRNEEVVLTAEFEGGYLKDFSGTSSMQDRFFMSSPIMRGFQTYGIGPRDTTSTTINQDALGGNMYAVARFEADFPLGLPSSYKLTGGAFLHVGSLWGLDNTTGFAGTVDAGMHVRSVIGLSLFVDTGIVGNLRFDFTKALSSQSYDRPEGFSFSFGKSF
ncbi:MAG: outer membrane protein assembly factor BamA [Paracoccaceae bacterium]|nr:outer membrane protein assembly factor BamA [Paracoccaceae bacterium]